MATNPQEFAAWMTPFAEQASAATGLDVGLIIAQWGNETAWGTQFAEQNNIGNVGVYSGGPNPSYSTLAEGVQAYINEMNSPTMAKAKQQWQGQSAAQQAVILGNSGYAGGGYNNGSGPGSDLIADMSAAGESGAGAVAGATSNMTAADWQALYQAGQQGGTAYLEGQNAAAQTAASSNAAAGAPPAGGSPGTTATSSTDIAGVPYTGTAQQTSALSTIETNLGTYGFTPAQTAQLTAWAWGEITNNVDPSQIAIDLQNQPAFIQQFPYFKQVNQALEAQGQTPLAPADYMSLTKSYQQAAQAGGLPAGMLTPEDEATLMEGNVSANELSDRINTAISYTLSTPAAQDAFNQYFGTKYGLSGTATPLTLGQMAAIVLDPTKAEPLLQQQLTTAQIGGASVTSGIGSLDAGTATQLAQAGITAAQATSTFQNIAPLAALETARPGMGNEATQGVVSAEQLAKGNLIGDAAAQRQEQTAIEVAKAPFSGGGGYQQTSRGAGVGSANPNGAGNS